MVKYVVLYWFIVFVIVAVLIYIGFSNQKIEITDSNKNEILTEEDEDENSKLNSNEFVDGASGSGAGNAGSSGTSGAKESIVGQSNRESNGECTEQQIPYSLKDFEKLEVCNSFQEGNCINKDVSCSLIVHNLDYNANGNFEIEFIYENNGIKLNSVLGEVFVQPRQEKMLEKALNFQDDNANKEIDCKFTTTKVPKKEVCN